MLTKNFLTIACGLAVVAVVGVWVVPCRAEDAAADRGGGLSPKPMVEPGGSDKRVATSARQPLGAGDKGVGAPAIKSGAPRNLLAHGMPGANETTLRNAIGAPVVRGPGRTLNGSHGGDDGAKTGGPEGALLGAKSEAVRSRPMAVPTIGIPLAGGSRINRAIINGTSAGRPTVARAGIGGPARPSGGINGTTIGSKR